MIETAVIGTYLKEAMQESDVTPKELSFDTKTARSTLSDHMRNRPTSLAQAAIYEQALSNNRFTLEVIHKFFGLFKTVDGDVFRKDPSSLDKLQILESEERKKKKIQVERILLKEKSFLTCDDRMHIHEYINEYMDEIVVEVSFVLCLCDLINFHIKDICNERMPFWQKEGYMSKE